MQNLEVVTLAWSTDNSHLDVVGTPQLGQSIGWQVTTNVAGVSFFAVSFGRGNTFHSPYGNLLLDPAAVLVGVFSAPGGWAFAVPNAPSLRGVTIFGQSLALAPSGPGGQFSNLASITAW